MNDLRTLTIKEIVTHDFRTAAVFEKYSLDFCCGGGKTIDQACKEKEIDASRVFDELLGHAPSSVPSPFSQMDMSDLISHIVGTHHAYVRGAIPALLTHTQKVATVHGGRHPEVIEIARRFKAVAGELQAHMMKEEQILFPYIRSLDQAEKQGTSPVRPPFGSARNPIAMMEAEHQSAGSEMYEIRSLSNAYTPPADACTTFKVSYLELQQFELDLHTHVHLENNILFPQAIALEERLSLPL
jgi:regulator of cell morphogenesis and NO signaling